AGLRGQGRCGTRKWTSRRTTGSWGSGHHRAAEAAMPAAGGAAILPASQRGAVIPMVDAIELNRLFWHSRRGMLELDVLLVPFVQEVYPQLSAEDQARYRKLLECEDQDMFGWFMQRGEPEDPDLRYMVRMILDRVQPK